jgi:tRNA dimethylallyltransferase
LRKEHACEIGVVEAPAGGAGDRGPGAKSDPDPGGGQHRQIVGAVPHGDRLGGRNTELGRKSQQRVALAFASYDRPLHRTGDLAMQAVKMIGDDAVEAEARRDRLGEHCKSAGDERCCGPAPPHRGYQRTRTRNQPDPTGSFLEHVRVHSLEELHTSFERSGKVNLAIHCLPRDFRNSWSEPERFGKLIQHLILDNRRFKIGDEQPLASAHDRLNENIDRRTDDRRAGQVLSSPRIGRIENEIAGLPRREPERLAAEPERLDDRCNDVRQPPAAARARDQGEHHLHWRRSYSSKRARHKQSVLIIAGPTASGKSVLALELADMFGGTVINADSMQIYRDLRILTARPDASAEARVSHRLYGFLDAAERGSAAQWRALALDEIAAATRAGKLPIIVGGTGLYLRALEKGLAPVPEIPEQIRGEATDLYRLLGGVGFRERLAELDPEGARLLPGDRQRLVRAYEVVRATGRPLGAWQSEPSPPAPYRFATILLMPPREWLYAGCEARFVQMIEAGALAEVASLAARGLDPELPAMKALGVPELLQHLRGEMALEVAVTAAQQRTRQYAKRQMTWFRHQMLPELRLEEPFSESLLRRARRFVAESVLTG